MSRNKKSRKAGSTGDVDLIVTRNRTESDIEGRLRKKMKKRKGLKTGSRQVEATDKKKSQSLSQKRDPRIGSKKPIPLVVEAAARPTKKQARLSAEKELELLENDAQLNVLLDRIDNGEKLGAGLQNYVDEKLDRIEVLMQQLGLLDDEDVEGEPSDIPNPPSSSGSSKGKKLAQELSDDELLAQFDNLNLDDFKQ